jgi:hypothetical protein
LERYQKLEYVRLQKLVLSLKKDWLSGILWDTEEDDLLNCQNQKDNQQYLILVFQKEN